MELPRFESQERSRKRGRLVDEEEEMNDTSPAKRCPRSSEGGAFSDLLCKDEHDDVLTLEESFDPEIVSGVMKSLADEIMCNDVPSVSDSASIFSCNQDNGSNSYVDIQYLLGATDDELGIPPSPDTQGEVLNANGAIPESLVGDLFDNLRPESEGEALLQLCNNSDFCYGLGEQDVALVNDNLYQEWLERFLNGDTFNQSSSLATDQTLMAMLEAGTGM